MSGVFDAYSAYYDVLYQDKDYAGESDYVIDLVRQVSPEANNILELGCGTGGHAEHFARSGFKVLGIDMSESMLERASRRRSGLSADLANNLNFMRADVRNFRLNKTFDVVLSLFHVFSYQISNTDLVATFKTAARHLSPGGVLVFDYWYGPGVLTQLPDYRHKIMENVSCRVEREAGPVIFPEENRVEVHYTMYVVDKKEGVHSTLQECHNMRYLFLPELELIASPLFMTRRHYAWKTDHTPSVDDWSAVSVMEKR